jgi:hypothetical protein
MALFSAHRNWGAEHVETIELWAVFAGLICAGAFILSLFGKPRLIGPIAVTCLGAAAFWFGTTIG